MRLVINDGGRSRSKTPKERYDCSVRALAITTGKTYDQTRLLFKTLGRKWGDGVETEIMQKALALSWMMGIEVTEVEDLHISAETFVEEYPRGTFLVESEDHYSAVIDGEFHDTTFKGVQEMTIVKAWLIEKL